MWLDALALSWEFLKYMPLEWKSHGIGDSLINPIYRCIVKIKQDINPIYVGIAFPDNSKNVSCQNWFLVEKWSIFYA